MNKIKKVTDEVRWMQSPCGEMFYDMDPQPASKEEAIAQARAEYGSDLDSFEYAQVARACGSLMPEKFPIDPETFDESFQDFFYEEGLFERHPQEAGVLWDRIEEVWKNWREEFNIVGNALSFAEGPYDLVEKPGDQSDPG